MRELTDEQRPKFIIFGLLFLTVWFSFTALVWFYFHDKLPLKTIGYDKLIMVAAGTVLMVIIMIKHGFLRPKIRPTQPAIFILRLTVWTAALFATMLFGSLMMHLILMLGPLVTVFNKLLTFICMVGYVILIEAIIIPTVKIDLRQRKLKALAKH